MARPPHQQSAAKTPALRGPTRSSQPPQIAAAEPRKTKKSVYSTVTSDRCQSYWVVNSMVMMLASAGAAIDLSTPSMRVSGSQNTENPYAMPIQRWMARAAGGTSQRLNPGRAMVLARSSNPAPGLPA